MKLGSIYMIQRVVTLVRPKKFKIQKSSSKVLVSVFWNIDGTLLVDYL
jgi:hypothetical protein